MFSVLANAVPATFLAQATQITEMVDDTYEVNSHDVMDGAQLAIVGMGIVFFSLILIWMLLAVLQKYQQVRQTTMPAATPAPATPAPAAAPVAAPVPAAPQVDDDIDAETLAVIMASVMAVVRAPARISRVRFISQPASAAWAEHGRTLIHTSHRPRKR
jgi:Na+-transporting methylmalonyl-CoA/oxaloacetate decarboxylase gamma subunit